MGTQTREGRKPSTPSSTLISKSIGLELQKEKK